MQAHLNDPSLIPQTSQGVLIGEEVSADTLPESANTRCHGSLRTRKPGRIEVIADYSILPLLRPCIGTQECVQRRSTSHEPQYSFYM